MDATTAYTLTARCRDLPELVDRDESGVTVMAPDGAIDRVVAAVAARREPGAVLQEKIDGCWCALGLDGDARVASVTSRAGIHLRVAVGWVGEQLQRQLAGWTLIGEVEAGTHWASTHRDDELIPRLHLYAAIDSRGREVSRDRVRRLASWMRCDRIVAIREAAWGEDWAAFTRSVLESGGEGVVIRDPRGGIWRAKPRQTADRYVSRTYSRPDRHGRRRLFASLSVCTGSGYRRVQDVLVPERYAPADLYRRVVVVVGASEDPATGMVRHARIADVRPLGEKQAHDCRLAPPCATVPQCAKDGETDAAAERDRGTAHRGRMELPGRGEQARHEPIDHLAHPSSGGGRRAPPNHLPAVPPD